VRLVGFIIRICHDARSHEPKIKSAATETSILAVQGRNTKSGTARIRKEI
jgi:hypothetical protein